VVEREDSKVHAVEVHRPERVVEDEARRLRPEPASHVAGCEHADDEVCLAVRFFERVEASAADKVAFRLNGPVAPARVGGPGLLLLVPGAGFGRGHLARLGLMSVFALDGGVPPEAQAGVLVLRLCSTQRDALACERGHRHGVHGVIHHGSVMKRVAVLVLESMGRSLIGAVT